MIKVNIGVQVAILIALASSLITFVLFVEGTGLPGIFIKNIKPAAIGIGVCCYIPLIILLLSQISVPIKQEEFDEQWYYKSLKILSHASLIYLGIFTLAWIWALTNRGLVILTKNTNVGLAISSVITLFIYLVMITLTEKTIGTKWYKFWHWLKN